MYHRSNIGFKSAGRYVLLCFALVLSLWAVSGAYGEDFKSLLKKAERGDANAQYEVGFMYLFGGAPKINIKKALEWYEKAASNKHAVAQNELGVIYTGSAYWVKADYNKARECFLKAGALNCGNAFGNLGWMYMKGRGVNVDYKQAFDYFTKGANLGDRDSMMNLGWMYSQGLGVEKNDRKAREWYDNATAIADNTPGHSIYRFMEKYEKDSYSKFVHPNDVFEYLSKRAETGNIDAMLELGHLYSSGLKDIISKDHKKAIEWYERVAAVSDKNGDTFGKGRAFYFLGMLYEQMKDSKRAIEFYEKTAAINNENGNTFYKANAFYKLGEVYYGRLDYDKAFEYYDKAAMYKANAFSSLKLRGMGWEFEQGSRGRKPDYQKAFKCYEISAKVGDYYSMLELGRMYENGMGTAKNLDKAIECYREAAKSSIQARKALARLNVPLHAPAKKNPPAKKDSSTKKNPPAKKDTSPADTSPKMPERVSVLTQDTTGTRQLNSDLLNKPRVAIFPFEDKSEERQAPADAIINMMVTELYKVGVFTLVEREHLDYVASELKLGQSGLVDPSTAPKIGRIAGAQYIMTGAVTLYYYNEKASGFTLPLLGSSAKAKTAYVVLDIRIIDVETSEIVYASNQTGDATNRERKSIGSSSKVIGGLLGMATRNAVEKQVSELRTLKLEI